MREIKFRAWHKEEEFIGDVVSLDIDNELVNLLKTEISFNEYVDFEKVELMQYTGIKDMNGKEIYEGDIFSNDERYYIVSFYNGSFRAEYADGFEDYSLDLVDIAHCSIVIGNVFENPELLGDDE